MLLFKAAAMNIFVVRPCAFRHSLLLSGVFLVPRSLGFVRHIECLSGPILIQNTFLGSVESISGNGPEGEPILLVGLWRRNRKALPRYRGFCQNGDLLIAVERLRFHVSK